MRIAVVGGGPAGLFFALLAKTRDTSREVEVLEQLGPAEALGGGIAIPQAVFGSIEVADRSAYRQLIEASLEWENVILSHRGEREVVSGQREFGISRMTLLDILRRRCLEVGVKIRLRSTVVNWSDIPEADLVVAADGANSVVRRLGSTAFKPALAPSTDLHIWLTTPKIFHGLTFLFQETEWGPFVAEAFKYLPTASTFIVNAPEAAWDRADLLLWNRHDLFKRVAAIFDDDLGGAPVHLTPGADLRSFGGVRCERWHNGHVVLIGDAAHGLHFSTRAATRTALEDADALADQIDASGRIDQALEAYERTRRPAVEALMAASDRAARWFEGTQGRMDMSALEIAHDFFIVTGRSDHARLAERDPEFVARWERRAVPETDQ